MTILDTEEARLEVKLEVKPGVSLVSVVDGVHQDEVQDDVLALCWLAGEQRVGAAARAAVKSSAVWVEELAWGQLRPES